MARKNSTQITLAMAFACYVGGPFETKRTRTYVSAFHLKHAPNKGPKGTFFVCVLMEEGRKFWFCTGRASRTAYIEVFPLNFCRILHDHLFLFQRQDQPKSTQVDIMTRQMTPEGSQDRYLARKAREEDLDAMVDLFNGFHQCNLFQLLYPGIKDASELSSTNRHVLVQWYKSPVRRLEVIVDQANDKVIAFCSWALDDSLDMPLKEKYYRGPGADTEVIDAFLDKIEHYDELLCQFPDFICKCSFGYRC
jgi:hypothetical protein